MYSSSHAHVYVRMYLYMCSYPTSFGQVPVLVIFVLKCSLLKHSNLFYILRNACLFWSKQATNILKTLKILLLMVQFHSAPSKFANLASGETGIGYQSPGYGKRNLLSQNWSDNDAKKNRLHDFLRSFLFARVGDKMTKTGTADLMKCASKIYFYKWSLTIHITQTSIWIRPQMSVLR